MKYYVALGIVFLMSLIAFITFYADKRAAKNRKWRVRESTLFMLAACFGGIGAMLGMHCFRHKTQKAAFKFGIPLLTIINFVCVYFIVTKLF